MNAWSDGWTGVFLAGALPFCGASVAGLLLARHRPAEVVPVALAAAAGGGIGQLWRNRRPKGARTSPWPAQVPPPGRRD